MKALRIALHMGIGVGIAYALMLLATAVGYTSIPG